jgi:RHS repeat-associated protein
MESSEYSEKTFTYDGILLDEQTEKKKSDQSLIGKYQLDYDNTDNITSIVDNEKTHTFSYDDLNRIKTSSIQNEAYSYDLGGNRNTLQTDKPFNHNTVEYQHDIWDRLSKVVNATGETVEYQYNGEGLMDERTKNGVTTRYYYDGKDIIAEAVVKPDQTVELKTRYLRGANGLIARISENAEEKTRYGGVAYYHHNQHGDVTSLRDKSGNVLNSYAYDIWGNILTEGTSETIDNPFTYSGEYWDKTTSLQYLRARWYDPSMGRFISEDSYEGEINSPLSLNRYTYGHNNPLTYIDPSGHRVEKGGGVESTNRYVTVNVTTFIPDSKIPETAYLGHGDGRDLWEDGTFRTKHTIVIDTVTGTVVYESKESSPSHISAFGFGHSEPAPSTDSLDYSVKINGKGEIVVNMKGDIASEALPENVNISYDFSITISSDGKKGPKLKGSHDGFPAYEVSVYDSSTNKKYGYGFNPRDNFEFIGSLMGKKEWKVNKSMPLLKK